MTNKKRTLTPLFTTARSADLAQHDPQQFENDSNALSLDIEYYQALLDDVDIPDTEKLELIETLWQIVVSFVELGFQIHPFNAVQDDAARSETAQSLHDVIRDFTQDSLDVLEQTDFDGKA